MSKKGIQKAAEAFSFLQQTRHDLMELATKRKKIDKTDLLLAQLMDKSKDSMKDRFCEITVGKI